MKEAAKAQAEEAVADRKAARRGVKTGECGRMRERLMRGFKRGRRFKRPHGSENGRRQKGRARECKNFKQS